MANANRGKKEAKRTQHHEHQGPHDDKPHGHKPHDLPYYDPTISEAFVAGMNQFARDLGILAGQVPYSQVVATQFCPLWR